MNVIGGMNRLVDGKRMTEERRMQELLSLDIGNAARQVEPHVYVVMTRLHMSKEEFEERIEKVHIHFYQFLSLILDSIMID